MKTLSTITSAVCTRCETTLTIGVVFPKSRDAFTVRFCPECGDNLVIKNILEVEGWESGSIDFLRDNKIVAAIKHCRSMTGWGLRESKQAVEDLHEYKAYAIRRGQGN